jgi:AcrR family transcriptional regulator
MARPKTGGASEQILVAAASLFAEQGPNGVSMDDIATEVGISRSSIFWHFKSKAGLLQAVVERIAEDAYGTIMGSTDGLVGLEAFEAAVEQRITLAHGDRKLLRLVEVLLGESLTLEPQLAPVFAAFEADFVRRVAEWFAQARRQGDLPEHVDTQALAVVVTAALGGIIGRGLRAGDSYDFEAGHRAVLTVVRALAVPEPAPGTGGRSRVLAGQTKH